MMGFTLEQLQTFVNDEADAKLTALINEAKSNDLQLAEQIAFMRETKLAYETRQLAEVLEDVAEKNAAKPSVASAPAAANTFPLKWVLSAAAGLLVLVAIWFLVNNKTKDPALAFADFMQPPLGLPTTMGSTAQYDFMDAMVDYKAGNTVEAKRKWQGMLSPSSSDTLHYYLAATNFVLKNFEEANTHYQQVLSNEDSEFRSQSYWYLALIALQEKNYKAAKEYLAKTEHPSKSILQKRIP